MSGIEVAGLLLGVLPVLLKAVGLYKDGIQKGRILFKRRKYVEKLALAVLLQQQTLAETVKSLLIGSGCEDAFLLDDDPVKYLNDQRVQTKVFDYLGPQNDEAFTGALEQSSNIIKKIARNITGLVSTVKEPTDNLLGIIRAGQDTKGRLDLIPRVKLMFGANELKSAVQELDNITSSLTRFTNIVTSNRQPIENNASRNSINLAKALRKARDVASNLYLALFQGWRAGCHNQHEAKLFLEDRIDSAADILKQTRRDDFLSVLVFQLIFAANISQGQTLWHEVVVQVLKNDSDDNSKAHRSWPTRPSRVTLVIPDSASPNPKVTFVDDICAALEAVRGSREHIAFVLLGNQQMGTIPAVEKTVNTYHPAEKITLKDLLLSDNKPTHYSTLLPLKFRMVLALRLASNLLQLLQTQWIRSVLSKDVIYYLPQPIGETDDSPRGRLHLDISRPFVSLTFDSSNARTLPPQSVEPKVALLELGILLLEIWHKRALEVQFPSEKATGYYGRLALACKWLDDVADPLPELYYKAVAHCVRGMVGGEACVREWEDMEFWRAVCKDIIEPLSKNCQQWR